MVWWGKGSDKPSTAASLAGDDKPPTKPLPKDLQKLVDKADKDDAFYDDFVSGYGSESTDSNVRYAAYASRIRTIMLSAHRYVAYTSDIGESFRPIAHPVIVRGAYGISWAYIVGDVGYEGYKAYLQNQRVLHPDRPLTERQEKLANAAAANAHSTQSADPAPAPAAGSPGAPAAAASKVFPALQPTVPPLEDYRTVMAQRAIFQSIASMGLPAFTIHSVVRYAGRALRDVKNKTVRTWGPIGLGLSVVPLLPAMFDKPVENAVEFVFHAAFAQVGGQDAVGSAPATGREKALNQKPPKEKEL